MVAHARSWLSLSLNYITNEDQGRRRAVLLKGQDLVVGRVLRFYFPAAGGDRIAKRDSPCAHNERGAIGPIENNVKQGIIE